MHYPSRTKAPPMLTLRPDQETAVPVIQASSTLLLADVGAGKTATILKAIARRRLIEGAKRGLVVSTKRICQMVWPEEVNKWAPSLNYASVAGLKPTTRKALIEHQAYDLIGLNVDNLIWAAKEYGPLLPKLFPWLFVDESTLIENPASKAFKAFRDLLPLYEWRVPATGTPRANHLYDIWGSAYLTDLGNSLGEYREAFLQKWFIPVCRPSGVDWIPKVGAEEEIFERLSKIAHRLPFKWHEPIEIPVLIPLNDRVKGILHVINERRNAGELDIEHMGVTFVRNGNFDHLKMLQLSSGYIYADDETVIPLHFDKMDALNEIRIAAAGEPMMVVYNFNHERDAILNNFKQARLITEHLADWNKGKIEMGLIHPQSCGHGLNAQFSGSDLQVWYTPTSDAELYTQTVGRMNRPGNPRPVRVMRLVMQGTKDQAAYNIVAARQQGERSMLDKF